MEDVERRFDAAMFNIYVRAKKDARYRATRYLQMLEEHGGLETARILLRSETVSEGYVALWERGRLDLTVEALVLQPEFTRLFSELELGIASNRLKEYGYKP